MEKVNNGSFFDFEDKDKHIIVSERELFDIIDKSENFVNKGVDDVDKENNLFIKDSLEKNKKNDEKYKNIISEEINIIDNQVFNKVSHNTFIEDDEDEVVELNINELYTFYEKAKKTHYFIKEKTVDNNLQKLENNNSQRNLILDKLTEAKTKDLIEDEETDIISDKMEILENNEENIDSNETLYDDSEMENISTLENNSNTNNNKAVNRINENSFKSEIKEILNYIDNLLDSLPEEKIKEFANSKYFSLYKKILKEL